MEKKRVLIVTQAMKPYSGDAEIISDITRKLSQSIQEGGMEIRVLMPRFGNINERRHRLHEVVRLSGINITVNNEDYPLIIKVGSLPGTRMQVYFLDNEDLFKRDGDILDAKNNFYDDNPERMAFFCKGVMEIVKKFGWAPDIIHCHGWMTSLIPLYAKTAYKDEPVFSKSKIVYSVYNEERFDSLETDIQKIATINGSVSEKDLNSYEPATYSSLNTGAIVFSDGLIKNEALALEADIDKLLEDKGKIPVVEHQEEDYLDSYKSLYQELLSE